MVNTSQHISHSVRAESQINQMPRSVSKFEMLRLPHCFSLVQQDPDDPQGTFHAQSLPADAKYSAVQSPGAKPLPQPIDQYLGMMVQIHLISLGGQCKGDT